MTDPALRRSHSQPEGAQVAWLLADLLSTHGLTVAFPRGARVHGPETPELWVPDLDAQGRAPLSQRFGFVVESKDLRTGGDIGLDRVALYRAERWQERMQAPVFQVIRDSSVAPVPTSSCGELDTLDPWLVASLHRLAMHEPEMITEPYENGEQKVRTIWYWPREVFSPLSDLLEGDFVLAPVPLRTTRTLRVRGIALPVLPEVAPIFGSGRLL
jgi:hypothetical protein